jgi:hypothetical protein
MRKDKFGYNIPETWDGKTKEKKMKVTNNDKQVIAAGIIKEIKEQYKDWDAVARCKLFATLYGMALKEKKNVQ